MPTLRNTDEGHTIIVLLLDFQIPIPVRYPDNVLTRFHVFHDMIHLSSRNQICPQLLHARHNFVLLMANEYMPLPVLPSTSLQIRIYPVHIMLLMFGIMKFIYKKRQS